MISFLVYANHFIVIFIRFPRHDPEENKVPPQFRRRCHHQLSVISSSNFDCFVRHRDQVLKKQRHGPAK